METNGTFIPLHLFSGVKNSLYYFSRKTKQNKNLPTFYVFLHNDSIMSKFQMPPFQDPLKKERNSFCIIY